MTTMTLNEFQNKAQQFIRSKNRDDVIHIEINQNHHDQGFDCIKIYYTNENKRQKRSLHALGIHEKILKMARGYFNGLILLPQPAHNIEKNNDNSYLYI